MPTIYTDENQQTVLPVQENGVDFLWCDLIATSTATCQPRYGLLGAVLDDVC
jgi:hypothetical protein